MRRRQFLKRAAAILPGTALLGWDLGSGRVENHPDTLAISFGILTDDPRSATEAFHRTIARTESAPERFRHREYLVSGNHLGSVVATSGDRLVDWKANHWLARATREIAERLEMPRPVSDPVLLTFEAGELANGPARARITRGNLLLAESRLDDDNSDLLVAGASGDLLVRIGHGEARIVEAECKHQTCIQMGATNSAGRRLVCVPNQVTVSIVGQDRNDLDQIVG